jgi:hypothetical protein
VTEPPELDRIRTALRTIDERVADQVKRCALGAALLVDDLPLVWRRVNVRRVDRDPPDPADVAEEAEHLLGGLEHRGLILRGEASAGVAEALAAAGWTLDREAVMVRRHDRRAAASKAREVALEDLREHSAAFRASRPYGSDPRLIAELAALDARYTERAGARHSPSARATTGPRAVSSCRPTAWASCTPSAPCRSTAVGGTPAP